MDVVDGMIFVFHDDAGSEHLHVKGELFKYLVKVRRHIVGDTILMRAEENSQLLHYYVVESIENRALVLRLIQSVESVVSAETKLHIIWCTVDAKSIEKVLPTLTELGVAKISFVACERSQHHFKLDFQRFRRIVRASMQQCGRSDFMEFERLESLEAVLREYRHVVYLDFCDTVLQESETIETVLIGCEGGFSDAERRQLASQRCFRLDTPMVLRSESAVCAVASKMLL